MIFRKYKITPIFFSPITIIMGKIQVLFHLAGRFLKTRINREISRTGHPGNPFFLYVVYFRGILNSQEANFSFFIFFLILRPKNVGGGQIMGTFHEKMRIPARKTKNSKFCFLRIQKTPFLFSNINVIHLVLYEYRLLAFLDHFWPFQRLFSVFWTPFYTTFTQSKEDQNQFRTTIKATGGGGGVRGFFWLIFKNNTILQPSKFRSKRVVNGPAKIDIRDVIAQTVQVVYHNNMNRNANIKVKIVQKGVQNTQNNL